MINLNHLLKSLILTKNYTSYLYVLPIAFIYVIVVINSVGFHHYDEHFQIVEFANYKMRWISSDKLTWEFHQKIRPGFQPFICYIIFNISRIFGITDGYDLTLVLRFVTAILSLIVINAFINSYKHEINKKLQLWFFLLSYFLWFLPYINVRFSSETWSGLFFILSLTVIQSDKKRGQFKRFFLLGLLLGVSILLRYQSCLFVFGIGLWLILFNKVKTKNMVHVALSLTLVLVVGFVVDRWLYGAYTFTFYNYFNTNIVKNVASQYGTLPWYYIILYIVKSPGPFGILIFFSLFIVLIYEPQSILFWAVAPFLIAHSIIPHKELRFLFPLANLCPLFLILGYQQIKNRWISQRYTILTILLIFLFFCNIVGLSAIAFTGASKQVAISNFIHRKYKGRPIKLILNDVNPYIEGPPLYNTFYDGRNIDRHYIRTFWKEDLSKYKKPDTTTLLIISESDFTGPKTMTLFKKYNFFKVYQNIPSLVEYIYRWYDKSLNDASVWVYEGK